MKTQQIMILGVGCILFSDEGFGIRVIEEIQKSYTFSDNVSRLLLMPSEIKANRATYTAWMANQYRNG